jgi:hypothetical protein
MVKISFSSEEQLYIFIPSASKGIKNIAEKFSKDIYSTSNQEPIIKEEFTNVKQAVIIVTLTECEDKIIEELSTRLEGVHLISGKYESYDIEMIENIFGVENALVICGSDRLGSIYGMFFVSKLLGVSPQVWFGDATPMKYRKINFKSQVIDDLENNVELETGIFRKISKERNKKDIYISRYTSKEPIIRYRGFFINDEWPCFGNWAMEHFGGLNSKMYEHIFEYLLRLNGNYLWPAMWNSAFMEDDKESIRLANSYGIYIGMSHHEPCNRSGIEYSRLRGKDSIYGDAWDYRINKNKILKFWEDGLKRSAGFRTIPTIGMRGENDSKLLEEGADITSNVEVLKDIIKNQNILIRDILGDVPKLFAVYKEVEDYFFGENENGLKGYDELKDAILLLCEDNHGNMRALPDESFRNHKGGLGMYYHFDYHGDPISYEWVCSTPISKVWEQMSEAYAFGINKLWIVNVGDVKFQEYPLNYFMDLAYDFEKYSLDYLAYEKKWVSRIFEEFLDSKTCLKIGELLHDFLYLNHLRRPEALNDKVYSAYNYLETDRILEKVNSLQLLDEELIEITKKAGCRKAYISLISFQARASLNLLKLHLFTGKNHHYANTGRAVANLYAQYIDRHIELDRNLAKDFAKFKLGKWNGMQLASHIGFTNWNDEDYRYPIKYILTLPNKPRLVVSKVDAENIYTNQYFPKTLEIRDFLESERESIELEIANGGVGTLNWETNLKCSWLKLSKTFGETPLIERIKIQLEKSELDYDKDYEVEFKIYTETEFVPVKVFARKRSYKKADKEAFIMQDKIFTIPANCFYQKEDVKLSDNLKLLTKDSMGSFKIIKDFGKYGFGIKAFPLIKSFLPNEKSPSVSYLIYSEYAFKAEITLCTSPANPLKYGGKLSFGLKINSESVKEVDITGSDYKAGDNNCKEWASAVLNAEHRATIIGNIKKGNNEIKIFARQSGIVLERILITQVGDKKKESYLGAVNGIKVKDIVKCDS